MSETPSVAGTQSVSDLLDQLWVKFLPQIQDRASTLQRAAIALADGSLSPDLRADAHAAAHKLAGSLGTFGFTAVGELAREAEALLAGNAPFEAAAQSRLTQISADLESLLYRRGTSRIS